MNIGVIGYYGFGNFGDELFLKTLAQTFQEDRIFPYSSFMDLSKIDAVIVGGGDLITPYHFNRAYFPPGPVTRLPTWVYGVGIVDYYPEHTWPIEQVNMYRDWIQNTKGLWVRDNWSAQIARKYRFHPKVEVVPDIAFGYKQPKYPVRFSFDKPVIGVCVFAYESFPFQAMSALLTQLSMRGYHIALIPVVLNTLNKYADRETCLKLQASIRTGNPRASVNVANPTYDLDMTYSYLQAVDYLISFKLHPSLVALRNGIPVLCLSKLGKVRSLLESFNLQKYMLSYEEPLQVMMEKTEMLLTSGKQDVAQVKPLIEYKERLGVSMLQALKQNIRSAVTANRK